ncbi:MAG: hypothetical protein R3B52_02725 [Candidatus Paceibacterota bacterium]
MKKFHFSFEEARYVDLWTIVHFGSGASIGFIFSLLKIPRGIAHALALVLLVLWEVFEIVMKIKESKPNIISDIIVGYAGFLLSFEVAEFSGSRLKTSTVLTTLTTLSLAIAGWVHWLKK